MTLKELQTYCHKVAVEHGWWEGGNRNLLEIATLLHSEISEFVEEIREGIPIENTPIYDLEHNNKPVGPAIELADLAIRLLDFCAACEIDLETLIMIKMKYNETRPYRHGNKTA